ncbi:MAG: hypothetical protein Q4P23_00375 [Micrococcaceae bacterium]|nr:hypothetical protein [Micrococcaceae bacterium]
MGTYDQSGKSMRVLKKVIAPVLAVLLFAALSCGLPGPAIADQRDGPIDVSVTIPGAASQSDEFDVKDSEFRWGVNTESSSGAFEPGTCNFLSAGVAADSGSSRHWTQPDGLYAAKSGKTRIEKPDASGKWIADSWSGRCKDATGRTVGTSVAEAGTGAQIVIADGQGKVNPKKRAAEISWKGSFTVAMYNGRTYWSASDPVLKVAGGKGVLTATLSGFGSDMNDTSKWEPLQATTVTLATLPNVSLGDKGIVTEPAYSGVKVEGVDQVRTGKFWGAFPKDFVDFQTTTGQGSYWYSSGGFRDSAKVPSSLYVSYTADNLIVPKVSSEPLAEAETLPDSAPEGRRWAAELPSTDAKFPPSLLSTGGSSRNGPWGIGSGAGEGTVLGSDPLPAGTVLTTTASTLAAANWLGGSLIPEAMKLAADHRDVLLWSLAGLLGLGGFSWVGFRRGWLIWPFSQDKR